MMNFSFSNLNTAPLIRKLGGSLLLILCAFVFGCSDDPSDGDKNPNNGAPDPNISYIDPNDPSKGPDWTYTPNADNYQTMSIILRLPSNLMEGASECDQLTALAADGTVCGISEAETSAVAPPTLYYLTVGAPACENQYFTIAYYSASKHRIYYSAEKRPFIPDEILGTYVEPFVPKFQ